MSEEVYGEMHDVGENMVCMSREHFRRDKLQHRKHGQLDTQTWNVSNQ